MRRTSVFTHLTPSREVFSPVTKEETDGTRVKPDTWVSDCRAHILSCQAGGAGRDTGKGVPGAVCEKGGTGELSGVARARRGGTCHGSRLWRGGLAGGQRGRAWHPPRAVFSGGGVSGGPAALSTVSAAG